MPDEELKTLVSTDKNLVIMGHTHLPLDRIFNNIRLVNPGAVSLSRTSDRYAGYAVLEATPKSYHIDYHRVPYDRQKVIDQLNALGHPARGFLIKHLS
jgi:protein phosphatase